MDINMNINVVFYSNYCNTCRNIMTLLKNENLLENFKVICVDNMLDKLPKKMEVPLMKLVNNPEPLYAQNIYNWITQIKFMRSQNNNNTQLIQTEKKKIGPKCFDAEVMTSISDKFAHVSENKNDALTQSYFSVNQNSENAIYTPPQDKQKIGKVEQQKIINNINSKREQQNNEFTQYSQQIQMELIMQDEYDRQQPGYVDKKPPQNIPKKGITLKSNKN